MYCCAVSKNAIIHQQANACGGEACVAVSAAAEQALLLKPSGAQALVASVTCPFALVQA